MRQPGFTGNQNNYFHETQKKCAEYNLLSYIYTCMKTCPCFEKQMQCSKAGWDGTLKTAWKFPEWIYRRLRIISRTRSRATQKSSEEIYRRFHFVNSSETFQHLCGFQETHWENGENIFTWTKLSLQRIMTQKKTHPRKNSLRLQHSILSLVEIWQVFRRQQTIIFFPDQSEIKKNRIWFLNIWSDK